MELSEQIANYIISGNFLVVLLFILITALKKPKEIIQTLDAWKSSKTSTLELALKSKYLKGLSRRLIEDKLEQRHFYLSTGLNIERPVREKILEVHNHSAGSVKFRHFVRASNRYNFDNSILSLKWGWDDLLSFWFLGLSGFISIFISLALVLLILIGIADHDTSNYSAVSKILPIITALFVTGTFYLYCWAILASANIVRKEIEVYYKNEASEANEDVEPNQSKPAF